MRWIVPSSKVGLGDVDTKARWAGAGLADAAATAGGLMAAGLALAGAGATAWAKAGPARMVAASSADGARRIAWFTGNPPLSASCWPSPGHGLRSEESSQCPVHQAVS